MESAAHVARRRVRAFRIVTPRAPPTPAPRRDVIVRALASLVKLEVVQTRYRGHAAELAREAAVEGHDMLFTLGGDGTINEAVNGLLGAPTGPGASPGGRPDAGQLPALVPIPGGSANVFVRALGVPADPVDATGAILAAIRSGRQRRIGLGLAGGRYFTFSGGLRPAAAGAPAAGGARANGRPGTPPRSPCSTGRPHYSR